jgi:Domain of unknown function (DUF4406)
MDEPMLIFVAGAYSSDDAVKREINVTAVHLIVKELIKKGHLILECHSLEHAFHPDGELSHAHFLRQTLAWLNRCDALFLVSSSPGANLEVARAEKLGLRIFRNLDEVPEFISGASDVEAIQASLKSKQPNTGILKGLQESG